MSRRLFCELGPWAYRISTAKEILLRDCRDLFSRTKFARERSPSLLPAVICRHSSLIRRTLGDVDQILQENKAENLRLAVPHVDKILIRPGETFSFWKLVGNCTAKKGYREGLVIKGGVPDRGIGGGMCQFTNLIHWMVLHTPLTITEHHHHDGMDLFPDYGRQIPFGTGTSIVFNYLDYRFRNDTDATFQLLTWVDGEYLRGELLCDRTLPLRYHIHARDERFVREGDIVYREGEVWRVTVDARTGRKVAEELLRRNHARVLYDTVGLDIQEAAAPQGSHPF